MSNTLHILCIKYSNSSVLGHSPTLYTLLLSFDNSGKANSQFQQVSIQVGIQDGQSHIDGV